CSLSVGAFAFTLCLSACLSAWLDACLCFRVHLLELTVWDAGDCGQCSTEDDHQVGETTWRDVAEAWRDET
ncbi:hypothetical protein BC831DRAFT_465283, partial [Entophlyctis helioformis]